MDKKERLRLLEQFAKQVAEGNPLSEDYVKTQIPELDFNSDPITNRIKLDKALNIRALQARDLAEDSLAHQVLKNTGIPIPNDNASVLKKEDFLKRLLQERYPELEIDDNVLGMMTMIDDPTIPEGMYNSDSGKIWVKNNQDILKNTSAALHEGAHKYDYEHLNFDGTPDVGELDSKKFKNSVSNKRLLKDVDPTEAYEIIAKGHHAEIPKLREGSFGLGALKSFMKSGNFKSLAGPVIGGLATAALSDDASASDFIPGLDQATDVGSVDDDFIMKGESQGHKDYKNSKARQDRLNALNKLKGETNEK